MATLTQFIDSITNASTSPFFTAQELDVISSTFVNLRAAVNGQRLPIGGQLTVAQTHTFWGKLCGSLTADPRNADGVVAVLNAASYDPTNCPIVVGCLTSVGEVLEAALLKRCDVEGADSKDGKLYADVISCFYKAMEYDLSAQQVLEFVDKKANLAIGALAATLTIANSPIQDKIVQSNWQADVALAVCVSKNLYELSLQATFFDGATIDTGAASVSSLTAQFQEFVCMVVEGLVASNLVETSIKILSDWLAFIRLALPNDPAAMELLPSLQIFVTNILAFVANILAKTSDDSSVVLRKHVSAETDLIQTVVLPYLIFSMELLERSTASTAHLARSVKTTVLLLKLLSFVTYRMKSFRPMLKSYPQLVQRVLTQPLLWNSPYQVEFLALCTRLCINAELEEGTAFMEHVATSSLTPDLRARLAWRLTSPVDDSYPVNTLSATYSRLEQLFDETIAAVDAPVVYATTGTLVGEVL